MPIEQISRRYLGSSRVVITTKPTPEGSPSAVPEVVNGSSEDRFAGETAAFTSALTRSMVDEVHTFTNDRYAQLLEMVSRAAGRGSFANPIVTFLSSLDRLGGQRILPANVENPGYTFITRPHLCFRTGNLRRDPAFAPLLTMQPNSIGFLIRALLDPKWTLDNSGEVAKSSLINPLNPFLVPLCNALTSVTGWPDPYLDTFTTAIGFHGEDQTFAIGSNRLQSTYDLSLSFQDIPFAVIAYLLFYWRQFIDHVCKGTMLAYPEDIDNQTICYTVSIYRFVMDPSRRYIVKYAKATGCFLKTIPMGDMLNLVEGESAVSASQRFTIPFVANAVEYNTPGIVLDFNRLVKRYCADIDTYGELSLSPIANFHPKAIPYIKPTQYGLELTYKAPLDPASNADRPRIIME